MTLLERNLEALRAWTPATAQLIAAANVPAGFERCIGNDGTATYRREVGAPPRHVEWLGGTSTPTGSAPGLIESLAVGSGNGLGLSIGTGHEWAEFAAKLANAQAVFVYEPELAFVRMVLEVCDLSALLRAGKIVLFSGVSESASNEISAFLAKQIGYEAPAVLHPLPTLAGERRNPLLAVGEAIVRRVIVERQQLIQTQAARLDEAVTALSDQRVAFTLTPRYANERPMRREIERLPELRIDHHTSTSLAARLEMLITHRPQRIISDLFRGQIGCVPPGVVVETWIPPVVGGAYWDRLPATGDGAMAAHDRVVVHNGHHQARLMEHGIAKAQIELRPLGPARARSVREQSPVAIRHRVALIGDLTALDPASLAIQLPTHIAVYGAAREMIAEEYLSAHLNSASDILRRALARAKVLAGPDGATDPALRDPMLRIIRDVLIPTVPPLILAEKLSAEGIALKLIGDWTGFEIPTGRDVVLQPFPAWSDGETANDDIWSDTAVLAHLSPAASVSPLMWDAVGNGVAIVAPQHPTDAIAGALPSLLKPNAEFAHPAPGQFVATIRSLLRDADRRSKFSQAALVRMNGPFKKSEAEQNSVPNRALS